MKREYFTTRRLVSMEDFSLLVEMQRTLAGIEDKNVVAEKVFHVLSTEGGAAIGLFDDSKRLRGFAFHFPCLFNGETFARTYRFMVEPRLRSNGFGRQLMLAQMSAAEAEGLNKLQFEVPILPFEEVHEVLSLPGTRGELCLPASRDEQRDVGHLLVNWIPQSNGYDSDPSGAPKILDLKLEGELPYPDNPQSGQTAPVLLLPMPTEKIWNRLPDDLRNGWNVRVSELLAHYLDRGYAIVDTFAPSNAECCPCMVLSNILI